MPTDILPPHTQTKRMPVGDEIAVEIVIPVYNEAHALESSVRRLRQHLDTQLEHSFQIPIADDASTDATLELARSLAEEIPEVHPVHLARKGRGGALRSAWTQSKAQVVAYMDVDLSTDLAALSPLLEPLLAGRGDIAIGSRLSPGAKVTRDIKRELISRF